MNSDLYQSVTDKIVSSLEQGVRPWMQPWSAEHAAGRITRPLRANGVAYQGINVLVLWGEAVAKGYSAPIWMTFRQALELKAHVRKGERGSTVVYASTITRNGQGRATGEETEAAIPFLKSYTVFNVEQIEGLPRAVPRRRRAEARSGAAHRAGRRVLCNDRRRHPPRRQPEPITISAPTSCRCPPLKPSATPRVITPRWPMNARTGRGTIPALPANSDASAGAMPDTRWRSWSQSLAAPSFAPIST